MGIGAVIVTQSTGSNTVPRENNPADSLSQSPETVDSAVQNMALDGMDDSMPAPREDSSMDDSGTMDTISEKDEMDK